MRLGCVVTLSILAIGCTETMPSTAGGPCTRASDCMSGLVCVGFSCTSDLSMIEGGVVPVMEDAGDLPDGGEPFDAGPPMMGVDAGPPMMDVDAGPPMEMDAGPPVEMDAGPPMMDAGPPMMDAGPPPMPDAGFDAGAPPMMDAGFDAGAPAIDAG